ncbi:MAG: glycosyltransferase [Bryobacteraceae bacterium]
MIDQHQIAVLFSGKLITRKRPMHVIEAIGSLAESVRQRFVAVFLGDGPERMAVEAAARRLNVPARILGFQNQRMLSRYYHASDMLMLPSAHETWGLVVNEALHHGLPCVVSENVGCAPDLIRSGVTGEIVARDSASSYGLALTRVAERLEDASLPEKCRDQVGGHTVAKAAEGIALAYRSVI